MYQCDDNIKGPYGTVNFQWCHNIRTLDSFAIYSSGLTVYVIEDWRTWRILTLGAYVAGTYTFSKKCKVAIPPNIPFFLTILSFLKFSLKKTKQENM